MWRVTSQRSSTCPRTRSCTSRIVPSTISAIPDYNPEPITRLISVALAARTHRAFSCIVRRSHAEMSCKMPLRRKDNVFMPRWPCCTLQYSRGAGLPHALILTFPAVLCCRRYFICDKKLAQLGWVEKVCCRPPRLRIHGHKRSMSTVRLSCVPPIDSKHARNASRSTWFG